MEIWKDIIGYEGLYQVSSEGNVRRLSAIKKQQRSPCPNSRGYKVVQLRKDGKYQSFTVHRLVALHFIPNPDNLPQINHMDGNKVNNIVENLEWVTHKENIRHAISIGLMWPNAKKAEKRTSSVCIVNGKRVRAKGAGRKPLDVTSERSLMIAECKGKKGIVEVTKLFKCSKETVHKIWNSINNAL